jgi:DedD protein
MPEPVEPQLDELRRRARRRLIGAIVLALAAAVLVPMLLESEPKPLGEDVSVRIPPVDDDKFINKLTDAAKPADSASKPAESALREAPKEAAPAAASTSQDKSAPAERNAPSPSAPAAKEASAKDADVADAATKAGEASQTMSLPSAAPAAPARAQSATQRSEGGKPAASSKGTNAAFSVQLAAFSDDKGANALASKLKQAGHPAYTEPYASSRGTLWRVRVGPYPTREAAESARTKLKADGQNGIIAAAR